MAAAVWAIAIPLGETAPGGRPQNPDFHKKVGAARSGAGEHPRYSAIGHIHRDFHAEPQFNSLRCFPFHLEAPIRGTGSILLPTRNSLNRRHHESALMIFMSTALVPSGPMRLRSRLNLVVATLSAAFVIVLIAAEIESARTSVREEIEAANRVASQLLGRLAAVYSRVGGPDLVLQFLQQLGRVRANEVSLQTATGQVLYRSPPATYKAGREAPVWFAHLLAPRPVDYTFPLRGGVLLVVQAQPSRAVLDAWDEVTRLSAIAATMFVIVNAL